ncbi:ROK family transcriptional regulator [Pontibacter diazotrophicus]|uniref:ROK family transcriptional regulator n=1 Tax=Pontibacter diazotrophicus TaxID=1400979 RepID=A0A3D8LCB1_9BACT|nr:ROK family transcriptional regulator [Pontibacter diazotrophicus]RDV15081.1 ROK family transcriptional regulator [Pontibacter diazotrophicus]
MIYPSIVSNYTNSLNTIERKKHLQKIKIIKHLYVKGAKTNTDICSRFNISSPTSMSLLNELTAEGLVEKQGQGKSVGGRKPDLYGLKDNSLFVLSIEMERYKTRMAILDNNNNIISGICTYPLKISKDLSAIEQLYEHANALIVSSGINADKLVGIGISMPGLVTPKQGNNYSFLMTQHAPESAKQHAHLSLQQILEKKFNKHVYIQNDVKSVALAEFRFGLAQNRKDVLVISMDWGIGLGIIMDGKLRNGSSGFAGEFGHIPLVENGALCHCGKRGCLETVASGLALARMAREGIRAGKVSILNQLSEQEIDHIEPQMIIDAANKGDQYAISILSEVGINLGKGIAILIQLFNPELIILGGKIAEAKQFITTPIQHSVNTYCMTQLREPASIALSKLGKDAGILGSVATVMENIFETQIELAR